MQFHKKKIKNSKHLKNVKSRRFSPTFLLSIAISRQLIAKISILGLTADSKMLIERARVEAQNHWFTHDRQMPVESIAQSVSNLAIQFGDSDSDGSALSRPFGVALLFAGCDPDHGPQLFHMDPSGTYVRYCKLSI